MGLLRKPSAAETYERRMEVFRLKMRGIGMDSIARELGVSRNTIARDGKWIKEHLREISVEADTHTEIGSACAKLTEIEKEAMYNYSETNNPHAKNNFLLTAIAATEKRVKIMMDAGVIEKAPVDVSVSMKEIKKLSTEELIRMRSEMVSRLGQMGTDANQN